MNTTITTKPALTALMGAMVVATASTAFAASSVLLDFGATDPTDTTWTPHTQTAGGAITLTGLQDTASNGSYSFTTTSDGNFGSAVQQAPNATWGSGTFDGFSGTALEEMQSTLGLATAIPSSVYQDNLTNGGRTGHVITVGGLTVGQAYVMYYIGGNGRTDSDVNQGGISLNSGFSNTETTVNYYLTNFGTAAYQQPATLTSTINVPMTYLGLVKFDHVIADTNGEIKMTMRGGRANINAFAFALVPEPSSAALLGIGGLALILRRRK